MRPISINHSLYIWLPSIHSFRMSSHYIDARSRAREMQNSFPQVLLYRVASFRVSSLFANIYSAESSDEPSSRRKKRTMLLSFPKSFSFRFGRNWHKCVEPICWKKNHSFSLSLSLARWLAATTVDDATPQNMLLIFSDSSFSFFCQHDLHFL